MGARIVDQETIQRMIDAAIAANQGGSSYLVYTALLTQNGTNAPTATVLENTLGVTVTYGYTSAGFYKLTATGALIANKTFIIIPQIRDSVTYAVYYDYDLPNAIDITTQEANSPFNSINGVLLDQPIEIRVYP
jgi:hypothetical protein